MKHIRANGKARRISSEAEGILLYKCVAKYSLIALAQNSVENSDCWFVTSSDDVTVSAKRTWGMADLPRWLREFLQHAREMLFQDSGFQTFVEDTGGNVNQNEII